MDDDKAPLKIPGPTPAPAITLVASDPKADAPHVPFEWLERITKLGALTFGAIYVAGFLVVNIYYSQFGLTDFSLFKARTVAAGTIFACMCALPALVAARTYGFLGRHSVLWGPIIPYLSFSNWAPTWVAEFIAVEQLYAQAFGLVGTVDLFMFHGPFSSVSPFVAYPFLSLIIWLIGTRVFWSSVMTYAKTYCVISVLLLLSGAIVMARTMLGTFWIVAFFFWCEVGTVIFIRMVRRTPQFWKMVQWETMFGLPIALLSLFSLQIYGRIQTRYGGGKPTKALLYLSPEAPKSLPTSPMTAWLLDEGDHGFYMLRDVAAKHALYIPREMIRTVEFVSADEETTNPITPASPTPTTPTAGRKP